jgi:hypothetical protein
MTPADRWSTTLAMLAVLVALVALVLLWRLRRRAATDQRLREGRSVVTVELVADHERDGGQLWRVRISDDHERTSVDVFSFRPRRSDDSGHWRHELMDRSIVLSPGQVAHIDAPPESSGLVFDLVIGWSTTRPSGVTRGSQFVTVTRAASPAELASTS